MYDQEISFVRNRAMVPVRQGIYVLNIDVTEDAETGLLVLDKKPHIGSAVALETLTVVTYSKMIDDGEMVLANEYSNEGLAKKDGWKFLWTAVQRHYVVNCIEHNEGPFAPDPDDVPPVAELVVETGGYLDRLDPVFRVASTKLLKIATERVGRLNRFRVEDRARAEKHDGLIVIDEAQPGTEESLDEFNRLFPMPGTAEEAEFGALMRPPVDKITVGPDPSCMECDVGRIGDCPELLAGKCLRATPEPTTPKGWSEIEAGSDPDSDPPQRIGRDHHLADAD